ncbi:thiol-disulfide oxidoreductase ResA [Paenibacillus doosanensis]|uniref:Thiol-disulfide oxidoreductase ResA n=1 Tax=Paenibacillus konkukensis TaxID=2020716 RepID=A0ABY4RKX8_9BACL|nr:MULTISPECIES: thiol-disulfide oxidoreductase ResA [Paenibacillus]MCS7462425.1 thiol-disulfide oxidoreductase ResA [Paenibacillus doosanensis]UQZ81967.1 Thiol-disulfide oxidoreductase ResA [Paenibacillus konkukensis]
MGKNKRWVQLAIFAVVVVIGAFTLFNNLYATDKKPVEGSKAPDFTLVGLDGKQHKLSDYKGKTVMVNFWGTFCPPCKNEMPAIQQQYDKLNKQNADFLGVNLGESKITVQSFIDQYKIHFPILLDDKEETRKRYGVMQYPTTFFIAPDGKIATIRIGEMDEAYIEQTLATIAASSK